MHPGFIFWWRTHRRDQACGAHPHHPGMGAGAGPGFADPGQVSGGGGGQPHQAPQDQQTPRPGPTYHAAGDGACDYGAGFGVRRPLRFLAYKLQLSDTQSRTSLKLPPPSATTAQLSCELHDLLPLPYQVAFRQFSICRLRG